MLGKVAITLVTACTAVIGLVQPDLPERLLVGYLHNWMYSPNYPLLTELPVEYDLINIAFAVSTTPHGATMQFTPEPGIYPEPEEFNTDIAALQATGRKVLISIGGANGSIRVDNTEDTQLFVQSMIQIIDQYGLDGMDIDLEGASLFLQGGDSDYRNPIMPGIIHFMDAVVELADHYGDQFILTMAPETAYVQGAYSAYAGIWGAYLPVIHALRGHLTYIHVQHYNTGSMFGLDGVIYEPATADFQVAMAEMLLAGFTIAGGDFFEPLAPEQVMI